MDVGTLPGLKSPAVPRRREATVVKGTRRTRSPHPGVIVFKRMLPSGCVQWRARFRDPDTGRLTERGAQAGRAAQPRGAAPMG